MTTIVLYSYNNKHLPVIAKYITQNLVRVSEAFPSVENAKESLTKEFKNIDYIQFLDRTDEFSTHWNC